MAKNRRRNAGLALLVMLSFGSKALSQPYDGALQAALAHSALPSAEVPGGPVLATTTPAPAGDARALQALDVGAIAIVGLGSLSPGDFADLIEPRMGKSLSPAELAELTDAIAGRARSRGFAFATAWIEPQQLRNGVLAVRVEEGRIDEVRLQGADNGAVRAALAPLVSGSPVRLAELERRLLIAGDIPGVRVISSSFAREAGRGVLTVTVRVDRLAAHAALANDGTRPLGPTQLTLAADIQGLLAADDVVSLTWSATPLAPGALEFGRIRYEKRISRSGTALAATGSVAFTRPGAYLEPLAIRGRMWQAGLTVIQPLLRRRARSLWLQGDLAVSDLYQTRQGIPVRDERIVTARASLYGNTQLAGGWLRGSLGLTQGLRVLGASAADNPLASRQGADGTFTALGLWSDWIGTLDGPLSLRLAVQGQIASEPLPASEQMGLGGTAFLRGYDWFERSGDDGVMGLVEVRYAFDQPFAAVRRAQVYAFVDGGTVRVRQAGFGGGSLASAGGGLRADLTASFGANLELAVPLTGVRYDTGDRRPKVNFRVTKDF